jgi:hypothetical protein
LVEGGGQWQSLLFLAYHAGRVLPGAEAGCRLYKGGREVGVGLWKPRRLCKLGEVRRMEGGDVFVALASGGGEGGGKPVGAQAPRCIGSTKPKSKRAMLMAWVGFMCGESGDVLLLGQGRPVTRNPLEGVHVDWALGKVGLSPDSAQTHPPSFASKMAEKLDEI